MCILQIHKNVNIWGLPLRFDVINYLIPMWHVCSNKFQFPFGYLLALVCVSLLGVVSLICISIYLVRNHLFHIILTMALPGGSNGWNYQQTFLIWCFYFLSLAICFILWGWPWISLLTGKIFPYTHCPWTIDILICGRIFLFILILALALNWLICCLPCLLYGS